MFPLGKNTLLSLAFEKELLLLNNSQDLHQELEQWFGSKAEEAGREAQVNDYSVLEGQQILLCLCSGFVRIPKAAATFQRANSAGHSVHFKAVVRGLVMHRDAFSARTTPQSSPSTSVKELSCTNKAEQQKLCSFFMLW